MNDKSANKPVFAAIRSRRSVGLIQPLLPPRSSLERMLEAAILAPNHRISEPWRFIVLAGDSRAELGDILAESLARKIISSGEVQTAAELDNEKWRSLLQKEKKKPLRAPVVIVVASIYQEGGKIVDSENFAAVAAAVENMLLVAVEEGLVTIWRTGDPAFDPAVKSWLGLKEKDHIVGFVYVGFAIEGEMPSRQRHSYTSFTSWRGWPEGA